MGSKQSLDLQVSCFQYCKIHSHRKSCVSRYFSLGDSCTHPATEAAQTLLPTRRRRAVIG